MVFRPAPTYLAGATLDEFPSSLWHIEELIGCDARSKVVLDCARVVVSTVKIVRDDPGGRVPRVVSDVVVHHNYDVVTWDAMVVQDVIGVAHVCLKMVVVVVLTSRRDDTPLCDVIVCRLVPNRCRIPMFLSCPK